MHLRKYEVFIDKNSTENIDKLIIKDKEVVNKFQEKNTLNFFWYAEIYDARTLKIFKVFADKAEVESTYLTDDKQEISGVIDTTPYLSKYPPKPYTTTLKF